MRVQGAKARQCGDGLGQFWVVFHGAGTERVEVVVNTDVAL